MKAVGSAKLWASLLAFFVLPAVLASGPAFAQAKKTTIPTGAQTLFECRTDRRFNLQPAKDGASEPGHAVGSGRAIDGYVRLTLDADSRAMTLFVGSAGEPGRAHLLRNVEQGSSPGSGAGGRADTTIRGQIGGETFTLFAGYENNGADHEAVLQISGHKSVLLVCGGDQFLSPQIKGAGRYGSTNIYVLSADGLAKEMKNLPDEPEFNR